MRAIVGIVACVLALLLPVSAGATKTPHDWLYNAFGCIHRYEGAWNANTGNGYYGGLQMDLRFQSAYGRYELAHYGTADRWPAWMQINVARRAYHDRGFAPWPSTRRMCGL